MVKGIIIDNDCLGTVYGAAELSDIAKLIDLYVPPQSKKAVIKNPSILSEAEVIMISWGHFCLNEAILKSANNLKAVFYAGGSIRELVGNEFWQRNILISSAYAANAIPVAQYTISQIFACLKGVWKYYQMVKQQKTFPLRDSLVVTGGYGATVGLISLGMIAQQVCRFLSQFEDIEVIAYSPYADDEQARELNIKFCSLEEVFRRSDVVSLHAPLLKKTEGFIGREHFLLMKQNSSFINTARGALVRENEMIEVLRQRPDITAILDVTCPEPPVPNSPLYGMDNVIITPHIAGSLGVECRRMGRYMVDELKRYLQGEPLRRAITSEQAALLA